MFGFIVDGDGGVFEIKSAYRAYNDPLTGNFWGYCIRATAMRASRRMLRRESRSPIGSKFAPSRGFNWNSEYHDWISIQLPLNEEEIRKAARQDAKEAFWQSEEEQRTVGNGDEAFGFVTDNLGKRETCNTFRICSPDQWREAADCYNAAYAAKWDELCEEEASATSILPYSSDVASSLGPFGPGPIRFGVEVEIEEEKALFKNRLKLLGHDYAVAKKDSSIDGYEIVTAPADVDTHLSRWGDLLNEMPINPSEAAGMHVHISRRHLSALQIGQIVVFINSDENSNFIEMIAGRSSNTYCKKSDKGTVEAAMGWQQEDRHQAVNLANGRTIEIRIFANPGSFDEFAVRLEFVAALVEYCAERRELSAKAFAEWVVSGVGYNHIGEWLEKWLSWPDEVTG